MPRGSLEGRYDLVAKQLHGPLLFFEPQAEAGVVDELVHAERLVASEFGYPLVGCAEQEISLNVVGS